MTYSSDILQLGNPLIREVSVPVGHVLSSEMQDLFSQMLKTVIEQQGMGLAAPQIGVSKRVFVMASHPNKRYPYAPEMAPTIIVNPQIIATSTAKEKGWEGCLTVPSLRGFVPRHTHIDVRYQNMEGEWLEQRFEDFLARIFQHEYDHLDGKVFIDRVDSTHDLMAESEWYERVANG